MLLDINVLVALVWPHHAHHAAALAWFNAHAEKGWYSCALTQAGFARLLSQPAFAATTGQNAPSMKQVVALLQSNLAHPQHKLLPLNFGIDAVLDCCTGGLQGHRQITDAYLLTLAIQNNIQLLTFDAGIRSLLATEAERVKHIECLFA
jgi:uncharacterized protein